jgi:hypothetical protein
LTRAVVFDKGDNKVANHFTEKNFTAFFGERIVASGNLLEVVSIVKDVIPEDELWQLLIFEDSTSNQVEVDFRGTKNTVLRQLSQVFPNASTGQIESQTPRRGRPRLGVVAGEITLLPRHWEWLKNQPGGASVTIRKLIDEARRVHTHKDTVRNAQEATYRFMTVMAGNRHQYEEALRALYSGDSSQFHKFIEIWPTDIREHTKRLAAPIFSEVIKKGENDGPQERT